MDSLIYFKALADETRIRLINILLRHELKVGELVSVLEMGQSRISRHLKILADAGLIKGVREGVWGFYSIARSGPGRDFIDAVRYLFNGDNRFENDLRRAQQAIDARNTNTMRFFDNVASSWNLLKREIIGPFNLTATIFRNTGKYTVGVDLGCGTGDMLKEMKNHAEKVIGVDSSPRMLEEARKRFSNENGNIEIRLGEIEHLPLSDKEADLAVISLVMQYLPEPKTAIAEAARILKPGGDFVLADFDRHQNAAFRTEYGVRWLGFDTETITDWLENEGFEVNRVESHDLEKELTLNIYRSTKSN